MMKLVGRKMPRKKKKLDECEADLFVIREEFHDPEWFGDVLEARFEGGIGDDEYAWDHFADLDTIPQ